MEHLFFSCNISEVAWGKVQEMCLLYRGVYSWTNEFDQTTLLVSQLKSVQTVVSLKYCVVSKCQTNAVEVVAEIVADACGVAA